MTIQNRVNFADFVSNFKQRKLLNQKFFQNIFESKDVTSGWDGSYGLKGRKAHDGTYIWKISFKNTINDKRRVVTGHVNLLRYIQLKKLL